MGYWLNSSKGIFCATCGEEVHTSKCFGKKGYIRVELNAAERPMSGDSDYGITPSATVEFCSIPCLKNANWDKIYADFIASENDISGGYYKINGSAKSGLEKTLVEQPIKPVPKPLIKIKPQKIVKLKKIVKPKPEPIEEPKPKVEPQKLIGLKEPKVVPHCGMCNCNWEKGHENTEKHKRMEANFKNKMQSFGGVMNNTIAETFINDVKTEEMVKEYEKTSIFENMDMAYSVIELYDYGQVDKRMYRNAVKYMLEETKKKYGSNDYRFRELFALSHKDGWEGTFEVRALCHAITLECPHTKQEDCERARTPLEEVGEQACEKNKTLNYKRGKCSHCRFLESIKEKWDKKD